MLAIRDKITNEARNLTEEEAERVADCRSEARHRRILKQRLEGSRNKASEIKEHRREIKGKSRRRKGKTAGGTRKMPRSSANQRQRKREVRQKKMKEKRGAT